VRNKKSKNKQLLIALIIFVIIILSIVILNNPDSNQTNNELGLSILFLGDFMIGDAYGGDPNIPFINLKNMLENKNEIIVNLETAITNDGIIANPDKDYNYKINSSVVDVLKNNHITILNLANNHILDYGQDGFYDAIDAIENYDLSYFGAGYNETQARFGIIRTYEDSTTIGYLGYFEYRANYDTEFRFYAKGNTYGVAELNNTNLESDISRLKQVVDIVIVSFHIGSNYITSIRDDTIDFARYAVDLGADAVVIHSPHIPLPFEMYNGKPIFYSIGNFIFTTRGRFYQVDEEYHAGLGVEFIIKNKGIDTIKIHTFKTNNREIAYHPTFLSHEGALALFNKIITPGINATFKGSTCIFSFN